MLLALLLLPERLASSFPSPLDAVVLVLKLFARSRRDVALRDRVYRVARSVVEMDRTGLAANLLHHVLFIRRVELVPSSDKRTCRKPR